jgi:predicted membrane-bound spermidine synthase/tetratricopeptide (TPR) repeat protein
MRRGLAYFLFLLSGATALCYEVAWTRHLVLVFGSTTRAVALILAAYMLGLALGSEVGGRLADRVKRPAVLYALAEGLIGLLAFAFPWMVGAVRAGYLGLGTAATPVLFLGAFALLVVPTFLMGATLPLLVRATVTDVATTGSTVGRLYGANILGAVAGTALTGFWLMEAAGVMGATRWAAAVNLLIAVVGFIAFRHGNGACPRFPAPETGPVPVSAARNGDRPRFGTRAMRAALVSAFAAGLVGLAAEVLWTRLLTFTLQGFTYTFSAMLATFLLGLALGGFAFGRIASRTPDPARALVRLHVAIGVLAAAVLVALSYHYPISGALWDVAGSIAGRGGDVRVRHVLQLVMSSAVILLPPAFLMGGVFPLAAAAYRRELGDLGARIGRLYAVNTVGAVTGSLVAGFVLAPLAGLTWGAAWVAFLSIAAGAAVVVAGGDLSSRRWRTPLVGAIAVAGLLVVARPDVPFLERSHVFAGSKARENRLVETKSGAVCQVSVVENERERYRLLYTDEFEAAGTKPEYRYMRLLAHLPVALAADPSRVLVICFGTGTTTGSVSTHSAVKRLDVVEISPEVLDVADEFRAVNRDALHGAGRKDLDVAVHVDDGRNFVLRSKEQWGVITLEPLMPYTPAAIHLYTEDFYRECAPRLAPGGVMCQWIPLQGMSGDDFKRLVAAFVAVFPDSACFFVDGAVALIGGNELLKMEYARVAERLADPVAKIDLADVGFDDPVRALATFVAGGKELRAFVDGVPPVTDERPVLEFHPIPTRVVLKHLWENLQAMRDLRAKNERLPVDLGVAPDTDVETRLFLALRAGNHLLDGQVAMEESGLFAHLGDRQNAFTQASAARESFQLAVSVDPANDSARRAFESMERERETGLGNDALKTNDFTAAEAHFRRALEFRAAREEDYAWTRLAETLARAEKFEEALEAATEATRLFPRGLDARCERAYARAALGDIAGARDDCLRALEGESVDVITDVRLRHDAERALAAPVAADTRTFDERIDAALAGEKTARVPSALVLRVLAADSEVAFDRHFDSDLLKATYMTNADEERLGAFARLTLARPPKAAELARHVLLSQSTSNSGAVLDAAARLVAQTSPRLIPEVLRQDHPAAVLAATAKAAGTLHGFASVDPLLTLLLHADPAVRRAAQFALFSLVGDKAPGLGRLDPSAYPSSAYRGAVGDLRAWWVRERGNVESGR